MVIMKRIFACLLLLSSIELSAQQIRIIPPQSEHDASHSYFAELLQEALDLTVPEYGSADIVFTTKMEQGRALHELAKGKFIDVYWAGTSLEREQRLLPVRVPLLKGLLGFRVAVIRSERESVFSEIQNLNDLKSLSACQGEHWPDSDILEAAGIPVRRGAIYELLFSQLYAGRCDFFPRGVHEGFGEVEARKQRYPELSVFSDLIVYYPFPMYFFVSPKDEVLAERIQLGLDRAIDSGFLDRLLTEHPVTSHLFPIEKWLQTKAIILDNPLLPKEADVTDQRYWLRPYAEVKH